MSGGTRREHCLECDPDRKKSKALEIDANGVQYCFRCHWRAKPCAACGDLFTPASSKHERCDRCFGKVEPLPHLHAEAKKRQGERTDILPISAGGSANGSKLESIWTRTVPLRGTLGEAYLKHRRCVVPPADSDLRFLPGTNRYPPSLCALVTNAITSKAQTLHFTRLRSDGCGKAGGDRDKLLLKAHPKAGGVIRLWPDSDVRYGLGIAEGIETALTAAHAYTPVWATVDAGNMEKFSVLDGIETLLIFADADEAGLKAARACGARWATAGRDARLVVPERAGADVNDMVAA